MRVEFEFSHQKTIAWFIGSIIFLCACGFFLWYLEKRRFVRLDRFVQLHLAQQLTEGCGLMWRRLLNVLCLLGIGFALLAMAQPKWGEAWREVVSVSRDILILLDTSESMKASDILPTRLERARQEIISLLQAAPGDKFGLIAFAGAPSLQCPLTIDHAYFRTVLASVDTDTVSAKGTDIAAALEEACRTFEAEARTRPDVTPDSRAVILISDGEDIPGNAVEAAQKLAKYARIYVMGIGTPEGSPVQLSRLGDPQKRQTVLEETHVSVLDEETLMRIATTGRGAYVRSQADSSDIEQLTALMASLKTQKGQGEFRHGLINRYQWPLAIAILCYAGEGVCVSLLHLFRRQSKKCQKNGGREYSNEKGAFLVLLLCALTCSLAEADTFRSDLIHGNALLKSGDFEKALQTFRNLQVDHPESQEVFYALGCTHYETAEQEMKLHHIQEALEGFSQAADCFQKATKGGDPEIARNAAYNEANAFAKRAIQSAEAGQYDQAIPQIQESIKKYEEVLKRYPDMTAAQQNLDHMRYRLKKLLQNPPPQQEQNQPQNQQNSEQENQQKSENSNDVSNKNENNQNKTDSENQTANQDQPKSEQPTKSDENHIQPKSENQNTSPQDQEPTETKPLQGEEDSSDENSKERNDKPKTLDAQSVQAILESLQQIDQQEQKQQREAPVRERTRKEWW